MPDRPERVTVLELFFDLVFVFTITQLTAVVYHHPGPRSVGQATLMLGVVGLGNDATRGARFAGRPDRRQKELEEAVDALFSNNQE